MKHSIKPVILLFLILSGFGYSASAQNSLPADTVTNAFFPALAYNSDLGIVGGGMYSRYHYRGSERPFHSYMDVKGLLSTKGLIQTSVFFDKPNLVGTNLRLTTDTYISRFLQSQYYGIGNYDKLADTPEDAPDYYLFKSFSAGFEITLRRPFFMNRKGHHFDLLGLLVFDYKTPFDNDENRLMVEEQPLGYGGARSSALGTGVMWEGRDSEFAPTTGSYLRTTVEFGNKIFGSTYDYFSLESDIRAYTSFFLIREITFANRVMINHTSGSVPYWKKAEVGGEVTMRGYPERRFLDDNALLLNTELRTWLLEFPSESTRFGGTLFMDIGRTFANGTPLDSIFDDLKYTFGFGGTASFFTPDFILRGDVGFSDEGIGVYFTGGYMF